MKTKMVVLTDEEARETRDALTRAIEKTGVPFWHWYQFGWIIVDPDGRHETWWRDHLIQALGPITLTIVRTDGRNNWCGFGVPKVFEWFKDSWDVD